MIGALFRRKSARQDGAYPAIEFELSLISGDANRAALPPGLNDITTFRIHRENGVIRFEVAIAGGAPDANGVDQPFVHPVVEGALDYMRHLARVAEPESLRGGAPILVQCNDTPANVECVGWESGADWSAIRLVPDLYYYRERGYEGQLTKTPSWRDRRDVIGWRGATTGLPGFTVDDLDRVPRYQLAKLGARLGAIADIGFSGVVQARDEDQHCRIEDRLKAEGLILPYVPFPEFQALRYIVDIDGNANAWNFMQKLRLGACMLRVASDWRQWFEERLAPWHHYVPIARDLSDFEEKLTWCRANPATAETIADNGRRFALSMRFDDEMRRAAANVFSANAESAIRAS